MTPSHVYLFPWLAKSDPRREITIAVFTAASASGIDDHIVDLEQAEQVDEYARVSGICWH